jgi:FkbM family methyltransferase
MAVYRGLLRLPNFKGRGRLERWMRQLFFNPKPTVLRHGLKMELDPMEWVQIELLQHGELEASLRSVLEQELRPGDTFVDVGSHVGFYSLLACHLVGKTGRVIAIDPQPYNANRLLRNAELNGFANLEVHVAAVGDNEGFVTLPNQWQTDKARLSLASEHVNDVVQKFVVPLRRLDNMLRVCRIDRVRLMKLDVIGYELEVIRGLGTELGRIEHLLVEILDPGTAHAEELLELLRKANYSLLTLSRQPWRPGQMLPDNNLFATSSSQSLLRQGDQIQPKGST